MTVTQDILNLGVTAQALSLAGHNLALATKKDKKMKDFIKVGTTNIVGIPILRAQSSLIAGL
tara:strand:- start:521 stop:706 length:186 start_codon:yes stop_codon:yes gene_type:complete